MSSISHILHNTASFLLKQNWEELVVHCTCPLQFILQCMPLYNSIILIHFSFLAFIVIAMGLAFTNLNLRCYNEFCTSKKGMNIIPIGETQNSEYNVCRYPHSQNVCQTCFQAME